MSHDLGIDVSQATLDVALLRPNQPTATGTYADPVALFLHLYRQCGQSSPD